MKSMRTVLCIVSLLGAPLVQGGSPTVRVPVLGFAVMRQPPSLRPIVGAVGAGVFGDPLALPAGILRLDLSPSQSYALAEFRRPSQLSILTVGASGVGPPQPIPGAFARSDRTEFGPSGVSAALYSAAAGKIQVIVNLPDSPRIFRTVDAGSFGSPLTAMAVSDDGATLLVGVSDGVNGSIYRLTAASSTVISACGKASAIRIAPDGGSAAVADSANNQVLAISSLTGSATVSVLAQAADGVQAPAALEFLAGGIAVAGPKSLLVIDSPPGRISSLPFNGGAVALFPLAGRTALALVSSHPSAVWLAGRNLGVPILTWIVDPTQKPSALARKSARP